MRLGAESSRKPRTASREAPAILPWHCGHLQRCWQILASVANERQRIVVSTYDGFPERESIRVFGPPLRPLFEGGNTGLFVFEP
jgi:hypothetical protein